MLYHGDANANIFIEANSFLFAESPITNEEQSVLLYVPSTVYNQYVVIVYII